MTYSFVVFLALLELLVFCNASDEGRRIDAEVGKLVTVNLENPPGNISYCEARHFYNREDNEEVYIQPFYNNTSDDDGLLRRKFVDGNCTFTFNGILEQYHGRWIITTYYNESKADKIQKVDEEIFMHLTKYISPFPNDTLVARESQYVTVSSPKDVNYRNSTCELINQKTKEVYDLTSLTDKDEGIVAVGNDCGVQMVVVPEREGQWSIEQESDYLKRKSLFTIRIDEDNSTKIIPDVWYRGSSAQLDLISYDNSLCELKSPNGSFMPLKLQNCSYTINNVENDHAGIWIARYNLKHSEKTVEEYYDIKINDPLQIIANVDKTEKSIWIASNVSITGSVVCTFTGPNKEIFISSETYPDVPAEIAIHKDGIWTRCVLSILKWSDKYYGEWEISMKKERISANVFMNVEVIETTSEQVPSVEDKVINVTRGDFLTIKCFDIQDNVEWDYCQIQSPDDRTIYLKTLQGVKDQHACNLFVGNADHSHEGNWICQYGLREEKHQVTSIIQVVINMEKTREEYIFEWYWPHNIYIDDPPGNLEKCEIVHVGKFENQSYELIREGSSSHGEYCYGNPHSFPSLAPTNCGFRIENATSEYLGKWVITTTYLNEMNELKKMNDLIFLYNPWNPLSMWAKQGQYFIIDLPGRFAENVTCHLFHRIEEVRSYELKTPVNKTMGACTFRIVASKDYSPMWSIVEEFSYGRRRIDFDIRVWIWGGDTSPVEFKKDLYEKSTGNFTLESYQNNFCNLTHPNGSVIPLKNPDCKYSLNNVSYADGGIWIAQYAGILGREDVVEEHYIVKILDSADMSISYDDEKWISVSCALSIEEFSSRKCEFHRPNGEIISDNTNNGISGYQYHEVVDENSRGMCYVIYDGQLLPDDFGTWKCMLKNEKHSIEASIVADAKNSSGIEGKIVQKIGTRNLYIRRGNKSKVTCGINATVDYCHLQPPNGKILAVQKVRRQSMFETSNGPFSRFDSCDFIIENADDNHTGDWICQQNYHERANSTKEIITVSVLDTTLVPLVPKVSTDENEKNVIVLECIKYPDENWYIGDCLWIGPNEQKINGWWQKTNQYVFSHDWTYCRLSFYYLYKAQIGNWTCKASNTTSPIGDNYSYSSIVQLEKPNAVDVRDLPEITVDVIKIKKSIQIIFTMPFDNLTGPCMITTPTDSSVSPYSDHYGYEVIVIPSNSSSLKFERICRLNISEPYISDYGMWKFYFQYDEIYINSTVNITKDISTNDIVHLKRGRNLELQCKIPTPINYCQMIAPYGMIYKIKEENPGLHANYTGKGFGFGECSASIELTDNMTGNWACEFGVSEKLHVKSIIQVERAEFYLYPKVSMV